MTEPPAAARIPLVDVIRSALTVVAVGAAVLGMTPVVSPGPWQLLSVLGIVGISLVTSLLRVVLARRTPRTTFAFLTIPSLVAFVLAAIVVVALFGGAARPFDDKHELGLLGGLIDSISAHLAGITELIAALPLTIASGRAPLTPGPAIVLAIVASAWLVHIVADALVVSLRLSWGALVAVAAMWSVPVLLLLEVPAVPFIVAIAACLALGLLNPARAHSPQLRRRLVAGIAGGTLVAGIGFAGAAAIIGQDAPVAISWLQMPSGTGPLVLSTDLAVDDDLGLQSEAVAYRFQDTPLTTATSEPIASGDTTSPALATTVDIGPMRISTLVDFDGRVWSADRPPGAPLWPASTVLSGTAPQTSATPATIRRSVVIEQLSGGEIPLPLEPSTLEAVHGESFDPTYEELRSPNADITHYDFDIMPRPLSAEVLKEAGERPPTEPFDPVYTRAPASPRSEAITTITEDVTADALTQYDQLIALQEYLRSPPFTYSTTVAPTEHDDPVWTFLTTKEGYCVQYATAMVVMARTLSIPARMAVGFLPGSLDASGTHVVRGTNAHTWPEFYFEGLGWVRFEPTPASHTGDAPVWTLPAPDPSQPPKPTKPTPPTTPKPKPTPTKAPQPTPAEPTPAKHPAASAPGSVDLTLIGLIVLTILAGAGAAWGANGARRRYLAVTEPVAAWRRVLRAARSRGLVDLDSRSPQQAAEVIRDALAADGTADASAVGGVGGSPAPEVRAALDTIVAAVEAVWYAPPTDDGASPADSSLPHDTALVVDALRRRLSRG